MIGSTARMLRDAERGGYAVPAVNVVDDLSLRAVVDAAVTAGSPMIIQISARTARSIGVPLLTHMFQAAAGPAPVPVALHLDHCPDRDLIAEVVAAGWSSVLFDASDRDLERAEAETRLVCELAHAAGVDVESEIENILGVEDGVGSDIAVHSYSVEVLAEVAERTGTDLLAPALGTAHGLYRQAPELRPDRVRELRARLDRPVVLHGGTGLTRADIASFIDAGVSKINVSTALKVAYLSAAGEYLDGSRAAGKWDPPKLFAHVAAAVSAEIAGHIEVFGSGGRVGSG